MTFQTTQPHQTPRPPSRLFKRVFQKFFSFFTFNFLTHTFSERSNSSLSPSQKKGQLGEQLACDFLKKNNYKLLLRNWRHLKDEIDIIAKEGEVLVFIEVKARQDDSLQPGFYAVNADKKRSLNRIAKRYLRGLKHPPRHFRFDIIEVRFCQNGKNCVNHYKNVLLFPKYFQPT